MMWMMRRIFVLLVTLVVICAGVVLIARANPAPDKLQALGFELCDGEPCWRDIKPGTIWTEVNHRLLSGVSASPELEFPVNKAEGTSVILYPSPSAKIVETIELKMGLRLQHELKVGDVVTRFGLPCRIVFFEGTRGGIIANMTFPGVILNIFIPVIKEGKSRIRPDLSINTFWLASTKLATTYCNCDQQRAAFEDCNLWNGFTTRDAYHVRTKRLIDHKP